MMESFGTLLIQAAVTALTAAHTAGEAGARTRDAMESGASAFKGIVPLIKQAIVILSVAVTLLISSAITYGIFYLLVMPENYAKEPLHFDYNAVRVPNSVKPMRPDGSAVSQRCIDRQRKMTDTTQVGERSCSSISPEEKSIVERRGKKDDLAGDHSWERARSLKVVTNVASIQSITGEGTEDEKIGKIDELLDEANKREIDELLDEASRRDERKSPQGEEDGTSPPIAGEESSEIYVLYEDREWEQTNNVMNDEERTSPPISEEDIVKKESRNDNDVPFGDYQWDRSRVGGDVGPAPPIAFVDLFSQHTQWKAHTEEVVPEPKVSTRILTAHRSYFVDIAIMLPESNTNRELGVFMVEVDLLDDEGFVLAKSSRSSMFPYESAVVGFLRKLIMLPPILIFAIPEAKRVLVNCFDRYVESADRPLAAVVVRLVVPHHASFPATLKTIQVVEAEVRIGKEMNWFQRKLFEWFYTCAFFGIMIIFVFQAILLFVLQAWWDEVSTRRAEARHHAQQQRHHDPRQQHDSDLGNMFADSLHNFTSEMNSAQQQQFGREGRAERDDAAAQTDGEFDDEDDDPDAWCEMNPQRTSQPHDSSTNQETGQQNDDRALRTDEEKESRPNDGPVSEDGMGTRRGEGSGSAASQTIPEGGIDVGSGGGSENDRRKEKTHTSKQELRNAAPSQRPKKLSSEDEEKILAERVMKGLGPYEIFTDLDEPD